MANFAVIHTGGKQYLVTPGQEVSVPTLDVAAGDTVVFDQVLLVGGDDFKLGQPILTGTKVTGTVQAQGRTKKVTGVKFHNKVRYRRTYGHRQGFTTVKIDKIS